MKKLLGIALALGLAASSFGVISVVSDTANYLELKFDIRNHSLQAPTTETYVTTSFPGTSFSFTMDDNFFSSNIESLVTDPAGVGGGSFAVNSGDLDFNGSYSDGGYDVIWAVDSKVKRKLGKDQWKGTLTAKARKSAGNAVPDGGTTLSLLGLSMIGLFAARRRNK